ncbi:MAG: recombination protein O N-terminal domain-containing protein [Candidatus Pacebacteria bacterium]|nr:recombination protein O N-terminal domain-containing protein [Candidatus Paceibacterota bacterium]
MLSRTPVGEASASIALLTPDFGLVRTRAQGIRKPAAKLAPALQTFAESDVILIRGKDGWRLSGAILGRAWFPELSRPARLRAGRMASLILRLVHGESSDTPLYEIFSAFLTALIEVQDDDEADAAECLTALRILRTIGVDAGDIPGGETNDYSPDALASITSRRSDFIIRINHGIAASGL